MRVHEKWKQPRKVIATRYQDNDFGYTTNGAVGANGIFALFDYKPSESKQLTVLDYGCGTGRVSRPLTPLFKIIVCFDPSVQCISEFNKEIVLCQMTFPNLVITSEWNDVPQCDLAFCINVIEHLENDEALELITNLQAKVSGDTIINYKLSRQSNLDALSRFLTPQQIQDDITCGIQLRKLNLNHIL